MIQTSTDEKEKNDSSALSKGKLSTSSIVIAACVICVSLSLFVMNYWHAYKCADITHSPEQTEKLIEELNKRILETESRLIQNDKIFTNLLHTMESNLLHLESAKTKEKIKESGDNAVKSALEMTTVDDKLPLMSFPLNGNVSVGFDSIADIVDNIFSKSDFDPDYEYEQFVNIFSDDSGDSIKEDLKPLAETSLSSEEKAQRCSDMKKKYKVVVGQSWGDLTYPLQQEWLEYDCDIYLREDSMKELGASSPNVEAD